MTARQKNARRRTIAPTRAIPDAGPAPLLVPGDVDACPARGPDDPRLEVPVPLLADVGAPTALLSNEHVCCSVYCDGGMIANALLALGSFKRFAPHMRGVLFTREPEKFSWLAGIDVLDCDEPLHSASIGLDAFARRHPGITGHYYRKVAMWLYMLEQRSAAPYCNDWHAFVDADVLFVRPVEPMLRYVRAHRFAAMVEHWHASVWTVFQGESAPARRQINQLFHGRATPQLMRRTPYFNSGFMLARPDEDMRSAVKDVLIASTLYPELSRGIRLPEQTLLNVSTMVRRIPCTDLYGLCVASYHDEDHGWPAPVGRHYLGDPHGRHPHSLLARYPRIVRDSLAAVGTSVENLTERGLWPTEPPPPPLLASRGGVNTLMAGEAMMSEATLAYTSGSTVQQHIPSTLRS
jgi:hypothetical protein